MGFWNNFDVGSLEISLYVRISYESFKVFLDRF